MITKALFDQAASEIFCVFDLSIVSYGFFVILVQLNKVESLYQFCSPILVYI